MINIQCNCSRVGWCFSPAFFSRFSGIPHSTKGSTHLHSNILNTRRNHMTVIWRNKNPGFYWFKIFFSWVKNPKDLLPVEVLFSLFFTGYIRYDETWKMFLFKLDHNAPCYHGLILTSRFQPRLYVRAWLHCNHEVKNFVLRL